MIQEHHYDYKNNIKSTLIKSNQSLATRIISKRWKLDAKHLCCKGGEQTYRLREMSHIIQALGILNLWDRRTPTGQNLSASYGIVQVCEVLSIFFPLLQKESFFIQSILIIISSPSTPLSSSPMDPLSLYYRNWLARDNNQISQNKV